MNSADRSSECVTHLHWDSSFFGFKIGRIESSILDSDAARTICFRAQTEKFACLYWLASGEHHNNLKIAAEHGFSFVDLRLELSLSLHEFHPPTKDSRLRSARIEDEDTLRRIAASTQNDTRFAKDSNFPSERTKELYATWISRDLAHHHTIVAVNADDLPVGFISCSRNDNSSTGSIGLLSVTPEAAGQGLGKALVNSAIRLCADLGCHQLEVVTHGTNTGGQRVYQSCGFRTNRSALWFHRWF
jgi:dTDP-4-amino-4,6-dideoxy-D-galactose acyltransferase